MPLSFDLVFVARSSVRTPPWLDEKSEAFLAVAPVVRRVCLEYTWRTLRLVASWLEHQHELTPTR